MMMDKDRQSGFAASGKRASVIVLVSLSLAVQLVGCGTEKQAAAASLESAAGSAANRIALLQEQPTDDVIFAWIECEDECADELAAVVELGPDAVPILIAFLSEGPPSDRADSMIDHLTQSFANLVRYSETHPEAAIELTEEQYVDVYLRNYIALYRIRSANALVAIGAPEASGAIDEALQAATRDDVRQVFTEALEALR